MCQSSARHLGLFVAFTAAQVWNDNERATREIDREASALRTVVVLASSFPGEPEKSLRALIRRYIEEATTREWSMMAKHTATLRATPTAPCRGAAVDPCFNT